MRQVVERVSLTQPAPIQVDSTEPEVIKAALEQIPGRAIVNSINLEAGRDKADVVVPLAKAHGAALIALTIDEVGMAKTAERKVEIAKRLKEIACDEHGLEPEALIFDALTFTLTTGDDEWKPSAVETIEGIRRIKAEIPGVKTSLGVSNVSFGVSPRPRAVLNSVFLHHCVEAGLDLAMVNPNHITPYSEISDEERELTDDLVFNRREDALENFIAHFESKGEEAEAEEAEDPTEGMEPEEALHWHILRRKKDGVEDWIDRSVEKIGAVPTLNEVLLPAMKEVGDKFGAGELILPFVLQSAEVMKRAVAQLENYLDRIDGHTKGKVVIATVFGDVHDIGKSLVNTILTNNGYTVIDLGKQVPVDAIIEAAVENEADAIGLSALLVSTSKQMPDLHPGAAPARARVPGADRRRRDQPRLRPPHPLPEGQGVRRRLRAGRLLLQGRLPGPRHDGRAGRRARRARRWSSGSAPRRSSCARSRWSSTTRRRPPTTACARARSPTTRSPSPRSWARARSRSTSTTSSPTSTATSSSSCTGAGAASRARPGASWSRAPTRRRASRRAWSACGASRTTSTRGPGSATSPATPTATSWSSSTPRTPSASSSGSSSRASPSTTGSASPTSSGRSTRASATSSPCRASPSGPR